MFSNAKVGDRIWNVVQGWGEVIQIDNDPIYPLGIQFENGIAEKFTLDGKGNRRDKYPCLYWDEIKIIPPPKPKRKVKKTVEGWASIYHLNPDGVTQLFMHNTKESAEKCNVKCEGVCAAPATLTYEIEE